MRRLALCLAFSLSALPAAGGREHGAAATAPSSQRTRDELARHAESLLVKEQRSTYSTANFEVVSDSRVSSAALILAGNLESIFNVLGTMLPARPRDGAAAPGKVRAYLFQSDAQYRAFDAFARGGSPGRSSGMYLQGYGVLALHLELYVQPVVRAVMIHECVHAYLDRRFRTAAVPFPRWLGEGLAQYVALSDVKDGRIRVGSFPAKTRFETPAVTRVLDSIAADNLSAARRAVRWRTECAMTP